MVLPFGIDCTSAGCGTALGTSALGSLFKVSECSATLESRSPKQTMQVSDMRRNYLENFIEKKAVVGVVDVVEVERYLVSWWCSAVQCSVSESVNDVEAREEEHRRPRVRIMLGRARQSP